MVLRARRGCSWHPPPASRLCSSALPWRLVSAYLSYISVISQFYISYTSGHGSQVYVRSWISGIRQVMDLSYISVISQFINNTPGLGARDRAARSSCRINEERVTNKQLAAVTRGGIDPCGSCDRPQTGRAVYILATLCRFDSKHACRSYSGPFIPCERRLAYMEILRIQGRAFLASF